jgi:hypothetical protein
VPGPIAGSIVYAGVGLGDVAGQNPKVGRTDIGFGEHG